MADRQNSQHGWAVFFASSPFVFLNFSLPVRADDLGLDAIAIGGMYTVFTGTMLLVRPLVGYSLDRFGRRRFFAGSFLFYTVSMLVFAQSAGIQDFYVARFLQGIGASLMWVSARTIIADLHDWRTRGAAMGTLTALSARGSMLGAVYGFTLLGFLPMAEAWMWAFGGYALAAMVGFTWAWFAVPETAVAQPGRQMPRGLGFMTPGLWRVFGVVFMTAFASALIEPIYLIFLKHKFSVDVYTLALVFLPAGLVYAVLPRYAGQWSDRFGRARVLAIGIGFAGAVSIALPFWPLLSLVAASYVLFAVGWACANPALDALVADLSPPDLRGTVMGGKEAAAGAGAALGPLVGGVIYEHAAEPLTFVTNGVLLWLTMALGWFWFRRKPGVVSSDARG